MSDTLVSATLSNSTCKSVAVTSAPNLLTAAETYDISTSSFSCPIIVSSFAFPARVSIPFSPVNVAILTPS